MCVVSLSRLWLTGVSPGPLTYKGTYIGRSMSRPSCQQRGGTEGDNRLPGDVSFIGGGGGALADPGGANMAMAPPPKAQEGGVKWAFGPPQNPRFFRKKNLKLFFFESEFWPIPKNSGLNPWSF